MSVDLTTQYLGMKLRNPLVVSACMLTAELDVLRSLENLGAAAAVLPSLFEEQIENGASERKPADYPFASGNAGETLSYFRELDRYNRGADRYLSHIEAAKKAVRIPIIASLNGTHGGDWIHFARRIETAGADALELNQYSVITDLAVRSDEVEAQYVELVAEVCRAVSIPVAVKLSPYFTALPSFARRLVEAGADGLILFNRFLQPDIDLDALKVSPHLALSTPDELRLPLRWIALLAGRVPTSLALTTGVGFYDGVIKSLLAGADVVMIASALYRNGVGYLQTLLTDVTQWIERSEFNSISEFKGILSQTRCSNPQAFERANYAKALTCYASGNS
ncbi:MAG TPA: dihydroorotate dehydrogenase-like protein [Pirellulales bacterium]|jgi:dihydroorotate dehydrogenase (fumarate)|nr:dihydroorotate dehydrogenase-like protein [Pirellulales bacterium]